MKCSLHILLRILIVMIIFGVGTFAFDVRHVGSIHDALFAPTTVHVSEDHVAVLEPISRRLCLFSADGMVQRQIDFDGEALGLTRISETEYIFTDRRGRKLVRIDLARAGQTDYCAGAWEFIDPTDIVTHNSMTYVLDAGNGSIVAFNQQQQLGRVISLVDTDGLRINFATCFDYNSELGQFYILDQTDCRIWIVNDEGVFIGRFGSFGTGGGQIARGGDLQIGGDGTVFVSDRYQNRILAFGPDGRFIRNIELASTAGTGAVAIPTGLDLDDNGLLYVASTEAGRIDVFFVGKPIVPDQAVNFYQVSPLADDTIAADKVVLTAAAEAAPDVTDLKHFQFELYDADDDSRPIARIGDLVPTVNIDTALAMQTLLARWVVGQPLEAGSDYRWRARVVFADSIGDWTAFRSFQTHALPLEFRLAQNYPNPFNPSTNIYCEIPATGAVRLEIFNLLGQRIRTLMDKKMTAGRYEILWDGTTDAGISAATGVYFYRLSTEQHSQTRKMVLIK